MRCSFYLFFLTMFSFSNAEAFDYHDNFEGYESGADFSAGYNSRVSSQNPVNFTSGVDIRLISRDEPIIGISERVPGSPNNSNVENAAPGQLRTGGCIDCVIGFFYAGSSNLSDDAWSEQRFVLSPDALPDGARGLEELWVQYDQYIPDNYHYRDADSADATNWFAGGHKVLALWADEYSGLNPTLIIGRLFQRKDSSGPLPLDGSAFPTLNFSTKDPSTSDRRWFKNMGFSMGEKLIIDPEIDKGHWQRRTFHVRMPTSESSNDGVVEFWVQRRAETGSPITEKLIDVTNGNFYGGSQNYINSGYLLGWSNTGYNQDVTYLVDNLIISDDLNSVDLTAIEVVGGRDFPPSAPGLTVE